MAVLGGGGEQLLPTSVFICSLFLLEGARFQGPLCLRLLEPCPMEEDVEAILEDEINNK